jgi:hypothetical protein
MMNKMALTVWSVLLTTPLAGAQDMESHDHGAMSMVPQKCLFQSGAMGETLADSKRFDLT